MGRARAEPSGQTGSPTAPTCEAIARLKTGCDLRRSRFVRTVWLLEGLGLDYSLQSRWRWPYRASTAPERLVAVVALMHLEQRVTEPVQPGTHPPGGA